MAHPKQRATAIAVTLALLTTGEQAVAQTASELETRLVVSNTSASAGLRGSVPFGYGFRSEIVGNLDRAFFGPIPSNDQVDASGRIHYMRERGGVWLGSGVARPLRVASVSNVNVSSGGFWTRVGPTTMRASVTSFFFTKVQVDSQETPEPSRTACGPERLQHAAPPIEGSSSYKEMSSSACRHESRLTDLETVLRYQHRLIELEARGGRRFGNSFDVTPESRQWGAAQATIWVTSQLAAVAGYGSEPAQPTRGLPARKYASLGMMLAYWPIPRGTVPVVTPASLVQVFELRPAGTEIQRVTARIGSVETVEVMGDFSDWVPLPMIRRGRDQWELLVPMKSGVHQMNMRIDGGKWIAPPGMPKMRDDFNGEVGIVVIKH